MNGHSLGRRNTVSKKQDLRETENPCSDITEKAARAVAQEKTSPSLKNKDAGSLPFKHLI